METRILGVLAVLNEKGEIVSFVYHNETTHSQVLMTCEKAGVEQFESLFKKLINGSQYVG